MILAPGSSLLPPAPRSSLFLAPRSSLLLAPRSSLLATELNNNTRRMRFASIAIALTLAKKSTGFAPRVAAPAIHSVPNFGYSPAFYEAAHVPHTSSRSTSLSLFRSSAKAARKFNAPAKSEGSPTEAEVRALFELWNSALATGDSRIVASRYTKVN
jgi:hypothetical protein